MASTKVVTVLDDNATLTAAAADHDSSTWTIDDGYGAELYIKNTNGATGPTIAAKHQIYCSADNANWYKFGGQLVAALGNNVVTSWCINIPIGVEYLYVASGSNTGQNTVVRVEGSEVTAIA